MTDQEINKTICEIQEWRFIDTGTGFRYLEPPEVEGDENENIPLAVNWDEWVPDYVNQLFLIKSIIESLHPDLKQKFNSELTLIANRDGYFLWEVNSRQMAEAYLKTHDYRNR
jgi:hypothetical protein